MGTVQRMLSLSVALGLAMASSAGQATVSVDLFQWKYRDVAKECEKVLAPKGVAAVLVASPVEKAAGSEWWRALTPVNFSKLSSPMGSEAEFRDMIKRCSDAGVYVYTDALLNHMALGSGTGTAGSKYDSATYLYPKLKASDFHRQGQLTDYHSREQVQQHDLGGLPDLDTGSVRVQELLANHLKQLHDWGVAGFRIDAAKHVDAAELAEILRPSGRPVIISDFLTQSSGEPVQASEYTALGHVTEYRYARKLREYFTNSLAAIKDLESDGSLLAASEAAVFVANMDSERGSGGFTSLNYKDGNLYRLANILMLAWPYGYPMIHSSYQFSSFDQGAPKSEVCTSGWNCEQRDPAIANMVLFNNMVSSRALTNWWDDGDNQIAFGRGDRGFVVINNSPKPLVQNLQTSLPAGEYCNILAGSDYCSGDYVTVDGKGVASVNVAPGKALALLVGYLKPAELALPSLNLRGSFNGWQNIPLSKDEQSGLWSADVLFNGEGDGVAAQHFRFDVYGNGEQIYGDNEGDGIADPGSQHDIFFNGIGKHRVTFDERTLRYTLTELQQGNQAPKAMLDPQQLTITAGASVMFDGRASSDADGKIVRYEWAMSSSAKCGTSIKCGEPYPTKKWEGSDTAMLKFEQAGLYEVSLTVTDDDGLSSTFRSWITVLPSAEFAHNFYQLNYRGTSNSFGSLPLKLVADHTWQTDLNLNGRKNQHFRLEALPGVVGGPVLSYGDRNNDGKLDLNSVIKQLPLQGHFLLSVNDESLSYSLKRLDTPKQAVYQVYYSGSNHGWEKQPMTLVADNTWMIKSRFTSKSSKFRFVTDSGIRYMVPACQPVIATASSASATLVPSCDCGGKAGCLPPNPLSNFGDSNRDAIAEKNGLPIVVPYLGEVLIRFNDQTLRYSVEMP